MPESVAGIAAPFALAFALAPWLYSIPGLFAEKTQIFEVSFLLGAAIAITAFPMLVRIIHERGLTDTSLGTLTLTAVGGGFAFAIFIIVVSGKLLHHLGRWVSPE